MASKSTHACKDSVLAKFAGGFLDSKLLPEQHTFFTFLFQKFLPRAQFNLNNCSTMNNATRKKIYNVHKYTKVPNENKT